MYQTLCHEMNMSREALPAGLYIVATPIGNLGDLSPRAASVLARADAIAVEDSRVTGKLLNHLGIKRPMIAYHDHNADAVRPGLVARLGSEAIALVSDAGTPLISDPGYKLVRDARAAGHAVTTLPGPCAMIAGVTLAGLPTDRILFMGFLPSKAAAREAAIAEVAAIRATLVLYESGPRLHATLTILAALLGARPAAVTREVTKLHEEVVAGPLDELAERYAGAAPKGEITLVVGPPLADDGPIDVDAALTEALTRLSPAQAAAEVARASGHDRRALYNRALALKGRG
jgi:16S rRNA (cytidine1402-2'-O)-methyltransferase